MQMYDCPKFENCSSAICPLYRQVAKQTQLNGERVCYFLTEYQKFDSETSFKVLGLEELYQAISQAMDEIKANTHTNSYLKRALKLASQSSSRMARGIVLQNPSMGIA